MTLQAFFEENPKAAIAFSGGVDSAFLLYAAKQAGYVALMDLAKQVLESCIDLLGFKAPERM